MGDNELEKLKAEVGALRVLVSLLLQSARDNFGRAEGLRMTVESHGLSMDRYPEYRKTSETVWDEGVAAEFNRAIKEGAEIGAQQMLERFNPKRSY